MIDQLNATLDGVRKAHPLHDLGDRPRRHRRRNSAGMIHKLNLGLTLEFLLVAIFIGIVFPRGGDVSSILPAYSPSSCQARCSG